MSATPISRQREMKLTAKELRLITIYRGLPGGPQDVLLQCAMGLAEGAAQRGERAAPARSDAASTPRNIRLASSFGKVTP